MFKHLLLLSGLALTTGNAQADDCLEPPALQQSLDARQEAPAPAAATHPSDESSAKTPEQELHPSARTVYHNGGHFDGLGN